MRGRLLLPECLPAVSHVVEGVSELLGVSMTRALTALLGAPLHGLITSQRIHIPTPSHGGQDFNVNLGAHTHVVHCSTEPILIPSYSPESGVGIRGDLGVVQCRVWTNGW